MTILVLRDRKTNLIAKFSKEASEALNKVLANKKEVRKFKKRNGETGFEVVKPLQYRAGDPENPEAVVYMWEGYKFWEEEG